MDGLGLDAWKPHPCHIILSSCYPIDRGVRELWNYRLGGREGAILLVPYKTIGALVGSPIGPLDILLDTR
jgi:hypothetical protein